MKVGIIQSNYVPWRGYFDFIDDVDLFVYYDDVQFSKGSWRNRNRIKTARGLSWLTVPICHDSLSQLIRETRIDYSRQWIKSHAGLLSQAYRDAPYFQRYFEPFLKLMELRFETISELNRAVNDWLLAELSITTPLRLSSELQTTGKQTDRLIELLKHLGATTYLSGPTARDYLEEHRFQQAGIALEYKSYDYEPYQQLHGSFEPHVSVLDLLFQCGDKSRAVLKSRIPNQQVLFD